MERAIDGKKHNKQPLEAGTDKETDSPSGVIFCKHLLIGFANLRSL